MKLVIACDNLHVTRAFALEEDEIVHVFQEMFLLEQLVKHELEFHFNLELEIHGAMA